MQKTIMEHTASGNVRDSHPVPFSSFLQQKEPMQNAKVCSFEWE